MKKLTRILGLCALVALATTSCKKDNNTNDSGKSFRATISQPTDGSKTHIGTDDDSLYWNSGDEIKVFVEDGSSSVFRTTDENVVEATFKGDITETGKYVAF